MCMHTQVSTQPSYSTETIQVFLDITGLTVMCFFFLYTHSSASALVHILRTGSAPPIPISDSFEQKSELWHSSLRKRELENTKALSLLQHHYRWIAHSFCLVHVNYGFMKQTLSEVPDYRMKGYQSLPVDLHKLQTVALCRQANSQPVTENYTETAQKQMGRKVRPMNFTWLLVAATFANSA